MSRHTRIWSVPRHVKDPVLLLDAIFGERRLVDRSIVKDFSRAPRTDRRIKHLGTQKLRIRPENPSFAFPFPVLPLASGPGVFLALVDVFARERVEISAPAGFRPSPPCPMRRASLPVNSTNHIVRIMGQGTKRYSVSGRLRVRTFHPMNESPYCRTLDALVAGNASARRTFKAWKSPRNAS